MSKNKLWIRKFLQCIDIEYSSGYNGLRFKVNFGGSPVNDELQIAKEIAEHTENLGKGIVCGVTAMQTNECEQYYKTLCDPDVPESVKTKLVNVKQKEKLHTFIIFETAIGAAAVLIGARYYFMYCCKCA